MSTLLQEVYAVVQWSLLAGLLAAVAGAAIAAVLVRLVLALGGLRRRSPAWQKGARAFHALFWIGMAAILGASVGVLRGFEGSALAAAERQQPQIEALVQEQYERYEHLLDEPVALLEAQRQHWDEVLQEVDGMGGWLLARGLARLDRWLLQNMQTANMGGEGARQWLDYPLASLRTQWHLSFLALYLALLTALAPLLLLPLAEWLTAILSRQQSDGSGSHQLDAVPAESRNTSVDGERSDS